MYITPVTYITLCTLQPHNSVHVDQMAKSFHILAHSTQRKAYQKGICIESILMDRKKLSNYFCYVRYNENAIFGKYAFFSEDRMAYKSCL